MKLGLLLATIFAALFLTIMGSTVIAQEETPPPYAGLKNPFAWNDTSVQTAGQQVFQASCAGCHGADGSNIGTADFSQADFALSLEAEPDFYFWVLSEGRLSKGMPPYKSSLSEEQRWQTLTYLWSLSQTKTAPPTGVTTTVVGGTLALTAPAQAQGGEPLTLTAVLKDDEGNLVKGAAVKFLVKADFFTSGLIEIGEVLTDDRGVAALEYTPRRTGEMEIIARHENIEASARISLTADSEYFYYTEAGIKVPAPGKEVSIGPGPQLALGEGGQAPPTVFRLPTGRLAWLAPLLFTAMGIWITYFYVMYQVFRMPIAGEITDTDTRRVPMIGLIIITIIGILLVFMLVTGPNSNPHLMP